MSSTNRGGDRIVADNYPTDVDGSEPFVRWARERGMLSGIHVEPCAGAGHLLTAVGARARIAVELRPECEEGLRALTPAVTIGDALGPATAGLRAMLADGGPSFTLTNPPFTLAAEFIETWTPCVDWSAFLLRQGFWAGNRLPLFRRFRPSHILTLSERPSFVAVCQGRAKTKTREKIPSCKRKYPKGTRGACECGGSILDGVDSCEFAWFVFPGRGARSMATVAEFI